jgi:hypothetical protein
MDFDRNIAEQHLKMLLKQYKIKVVKWCKSACGRAWVDKKEIAIPKPTDIINFCVAMHEIGHVIDGCHPMKLYRSEYKAEMFAMGQSKLLGFDCSKYEKRAKGYVIMCVAKGHCRKLNLKNIEQDVRDFCGIDFNEWEGKKVFVSGWVTGSLKIRYDNE